MSDELAEIDTTEEEFDAMRADADPIDAAIQANEICVRWVGDFWAWCCQRHGDGAAWLSDNPADNPAGRTEIAEHLAEHAAFDSQPRQVARRAIIEVFGQPHFWTDQETADAVLDAVEPILITAGREAAAADIVRSGEGSFDFDDYSAWKHANVYARIARGGH